MSRKESRDTMRKKDIINTLSDYKKEFAEEYGILEIGVFGSVAREEAIESSDVDVVIRIAKPDLFMLVGIKQDLEKRLHRPVDIVTYRETMNPFLKKRIDGEAVYA
ncbi:nucleotidyltransferase family protein [Desulfococcus sp.]|uniref:nucleotidyltransferase family protein n=1 Tax=Desulfococcus sp. TaxID=2025834 RepID=UPI0035934CF2